MQNKYEPREGEIHYARRRILHDERKRVDKGNLRGDNEEIFDSLRFYTRCASSEEAANGGL